MTGAGLGTGAAPMTEAELRARLAERLGSAIEARWIVEEALARCGNGHRPCPASPHHVPRAAVDRALALGERRCGGEPLQYVLGHWPFRRLELKVDSRALIPRPETEQLVGLALERASAMLGERRDPIVVDLGTGCGAIALSILDELAPARPGLSVWAVDDDAGALSLAGENVERLRPRAFLGRHSVHLCRGSWWEALPQELRGRVDVVVSNPPYVSAREWPALEPVVRDHEPVHALVAEDGPWDIPGLAAVASVLADAPAWLARPGLAVIELSPVQAAAGVRLARTVGFDGAEVHDDLAGRHRILVASLRRREPAP